MGRSWDREVAGTGSERWQHGKLGLWEEQGWRRLVGGMLDPCPQDPSVNGVISTGLQCSGPRALIIPDINKGTKHLPTADPGLELGRGGGRRQDWSLRSPKARRLVSWLSFQTLARLWRGCV